MRSTLLALASVLLLFAGEVRGEISAEKRAAIEELFRLTGMEKLIDQMTAQMISGLRTGDPRIPQAFWEKLAKRMDAREMLELAVPVYDKHYTLEDIRAVNAFYASPVGQKVLAATPLVMQETMAIGQEWGSRHGKAAEEEVRAESKTLDAAPK